MVYPKDDVFDSIDVAWNGLNASLVGMTSRQIEVLKLLYKDRLTLKEAGKRLSPPVTGARVRQIEMKAFLRFSRYPNSRILKGCIAGYWKLMYPQTDAGINGTIKKHK